MNGGVIALTIASKAFISLARVTARSFKAHHPDIPFILFLTDEVGNYFDPAKEPFQLITLDDLPLKNRERMRFQYTQQELSYAVTPHVIAYLIQQGCDGVIFLKQETLVLDTLTPVTERLHKHPMMLTPHLLAPLQRSDAAMLELDVLRAGVYNGGVVLTANHPASRRFLEWWKMRTSLDCYCRVEEGLHYEQRWLDFALSLVPDVNIIRDPGMNVGHWNLDERDVKVNDGKVTTKGNPCRVFRFSGYDPDYPDRITKYYPDRSVTGTDEVAWVFQRYHQMLMDEGYEESRNWPYAYACYDNGLEIGQAHRDIYRQLGDDAVRFGDPLVTTGENSFLSWIMSGGQMVGDA